MVFIQYEQTDVLDGAFVLIDKTGIRTHIPVDSIACIRLMSSWLGRAAMNPGAPCHHPVTGLIHTSP